MTVPKHVVRDVFVIFLCATVLGLSLSAILHKAASQFNPFLSNAISQTVNVFVSQGLDVGNSSAPSFSTVVHRSSPSPQPARTSTSNATESPALVDTSFQGLVTPAPSAPLDELDEVLAKTANQNKTVLLTALNEAWAEPNTMIDLFLESFRIGQGTQKLLHNLLIVALDAKSYNRCLAIHPHCYTLKTRGIDFSAEKVYMSEDYLKMMWRRLGFLGEILKRGYSFVFSDADIMWLRDPFTIFSKDADIQIASDRFNGRPYDVSNSPNGGYKFVRSNERTISFYRYWYLSRRLFPGQNEQDVLNIVKFTRGFGRRGLKFMFLDTKHFGGFCERSPYLDDVYTMHANCCRGLKAKLIDLRETLDDWTRYKSLPDNNATTKALVQWKSPDACLNSWGR